MKHLKFIFVMAALLVSATTFAQQKLSGTVIDDLNEPVTGASVVVKGSQQGAISDLDGHFALVCEPGTTLVISYLGYTTQEVKAADGMTVKLQPDAASLDEVVVVGYGVQKKSVVTASIAKVSADDLASTAPMRVDNALKGLAAGVQVTSASGQPGAAARVRVRGIGTINSSDPLYIVDGMPIEGNIDYINPSDIESIEVLKDAASGAVYGARAANGVVLVTTKGGKMGKVSVNYNFSYGWQTAWKHRSVLNATEYAVMKNEGYVNSGLAPIYDDPYSYGEGTDWQDAVFNDNAPVMNHEVNVSGATDKVNYYLSLGYYSQDGIVGGNYDRSNYDRLTVRSNTKYTLFETKEREWLNKLTIQSNLSYAHIKTTGIDTNSQWGSVLGSALTLSPLLPITVSGADADAELARWSSEDRYTPIYDKNGNLYYTPGSAYNEMNNPLAMLELPGTENWYHKVVANFQAELSLGYGFKWRTSYGVDLTFNGVDNGYTPKYYLSGNNVSTKTTASASSNRQTVWQLENVLMWDKQYGAHTINVFKFRK